SLAKRSAQASKAAFGLFAVRVALALATGAASAPPGAAAVANASGMNRAATAARRLRGVKIGMVSLLFIVRQSAVANLTWKSYARQSLQGRPPGSILAVGDDVQAGFLRRAPAAREAPLPALVLDHDLPVRHLERG